MGLQGSGSLGDIPSGHGPLPSQRWKGREWASILLPWTVAEIPSISGAWDSWNPKAKQSWRCIPSSELTWFGWQNDLEPGPCFSFCSLAHSCGMPSAICVAKYWALGHWAEQDGGTPLSRIMLKCLRRNVEAAGTPNKDLYQIVASCPSLPVQTSSNHRSKCVPGGHSLGAGDMSNYFQTVRSLTDGRHDERGTWINL